MHFINQKSVKSNHICTWLFKQSAKTQTNFNNLNNMIIAEVMENTLNI